MERNEARWLRSEVKVEGNAEEGKHSAPVERALRINVGSFSFVLFIVKNTTKTGERTKKAFMIPEDQFILYRLCC